MPVSPDSWVPGCLGSRMPGFPESLMKGAEMTNVQGVSLDLTTPDGTADAYLAWLAGWPLGADGPVGTAGYCMGGVLAIRTAAAFPDRIAAAAAFHAGRLATDAEDSPHRLVDRITAELYFGHADQDPSLP